MQEGISQKSNEAAQYGFLTNMFRKGDSVFVEHNGRKAVLVSEPEWDKEKLDAIKKDTDPNPKYLISIKYFDDNSISRVPAKDLRFESHIMPPTPGARGVQ